MSNLRRFLPKFARLRACSSEDFVEARSEVFVIVLSALLPMWLCIFLALFSLKVNALTDFVKSYTTTGDALLTSCALIGPLTYVLWRQYGELPSHLTMRFPYGLGLSLSVLAIWAISGSAFGYSRNASPLLNGSSTTLLSLFVLFFSIAVLYFATVLRNNIDRIDASVLMHDEQEDFVKEFTDG
jgi:hypothetical protein